MDVRPYLPADRDACLAVFDSNTPEFFRPHERRDLENFLDRPKCPYFVMDHDGTIVGSGGYFMDVEGQLASLVWGMIHSNWHRKGLGRFLLLFRLREITKAGGIQIVVLQTSQHAAPFFESQGFKVMRVTKDGYAPGLDRIEMTMKLTVCP
jgi:N-acetylglutamate synthase-like GNAT family acetyltransferase